VLGAEEKNYGNVLHCNLAFRSYGNFLFHKSVMNILEEANEITGGERNDSYGHPRFDFTRTAKLWSAFLGIEITPEQIPLLMILLKVSREANKHKRDNLTDIAGYARTREMLDENKNKNAFSHIRRPGEAP
jgi:hypothetical protein